MKRIRLTLCLIAFSAPFTLFSMETELQTIGKENKKIPTSAIVNPKNIVKIIDQTINNKYSSTIPVIDYYNASQSTETAILTTLSIVNASSILSTQILDDLYKKNIFFAKAVDYFSNFARKNLDNVNHATIDIVNNPTLNQPEKKLNKLALTIKEYIMFRVRDEIALSYTMNFQHPQPVNCFNICPITHTLATHNRNKDLCLWDLKTNSCITSLPESDHLSLIRFNTDGSQMATVAYYKTSNNLYASRIKIWNPPLKHLVHVITQKYLAYHIDFMKKKSNHILAVFTKKPGNNKRMLTLWSTNQAIPTVIGKTPPLPWQGEYSTISDPIKKNNYTGFVHPQSSSTICVIKKNCHELHLCKQAIENNVHTETLANIYNSRTYHKLTTCEKTIINKK